MVSFLQRLFLQLSSFLLLILFKGETRQLELLQSDRIPQALYRTRPYLYP